MKLERIIITAAINKGKSKSTSILVQSGKLKETLNFYSILNYFPENFIFEHFKNISKNKAKKD